MTKHITFNSKEMAINQAISDENKAALLQDIQKQLLAVEDDRAAGCKGCSVDELDSYLDSILGQCKRR